MATCPSISLMGNPRRCLHTLARLTNAYPYGLCPLKALRDYDRRTRIDRSQKAHEYAEGLLRTVLDGSSSSSSTTTTTSHEGHHLPREHPLNSQSPGAPPHRQEPPNEDTTLHQEPPRAAATQHQESPSIAAVQHQQPPRAAATQHHESPSIAAVQHQEPPRAAATQHQESPSIAAVQHQEPPRAAATQHQESPSIAAVQHQQPPEVGEAVAVVQPDSTATSPKVWLARCLKVDGNEIIVIPFREVGRGVFIFHVGGGRQRIPLKTTISPIDFVHCPDDNTYRLRTSKTEIHLCMSPLM